MSVAFSDLEWGMAGRYLRAKRRDSYISVIAVISFLGIALGVATLIVVMAVMTGFRADLMERILGVNGHARIESRAGVFSDKAALVSIIAQQDGVVRVRPMIDGQVMASISGQVLGQVVRGIPVDNIKELESLNGNIVSGELDSLKGGAHVAIGARLAERFGLGIGDGVSLITPQGSVTPFGTLPKVRRFTIGAVFEVGLSDYDTNIMFMDFDALAGFLGRPEAGGIIEIDVSDPDKVRDVREAIELAIGPNYRVRDWKSINATLAGALEVERTVMFLILTLILLVAALNIISGMVMLVRDKGRDIAILRAMGASRGMIMRVFFITGASIGILGTFFGVGIGSIFCLYIEEVRQFLIWITGADLFPAQVYFLQELPATIVWEDVLRVVGMALGLSFLSTLYPAWRAAKLDPVEALRYE